MKIICSALLLGSSLLFRLCSKEDHNSPEEPTVVGNYIIKTIDGFGNPVKNAKIVYEFHSCEYDYENPDTVLSNSQGLAGLTVPAGESVRIHIVGFVYESSICYSPGRRPDTATVFAAPIPTYVFTTPNATVNWFVNNAYDCKYEATVGTLVNADANGKAIIYLPRGEMYKVQIGTAIRCLQPEQNIDTLYF